MRNIYLWAAIAWTLLITILCLVSTDSLGEVNNFELPYKDKYGHFVFYFIFTLLWFAYLKYRGRSSNKRMILYAVLAAFIYGSLMELSQNFFTEGREADIWDVVFNMLGSFAAVLLIRLIQKSKK